MISFLPTQCMIFSIRFVVQSVKDFHPCKCKPIRKTATPHAKQKRQGFHPYRLMFIFSQRRRHGYHRAFSLPESVRRIAPPVWIDSHHASLFWKLLHLMQNKSGRASTIPLDVYFLPTQTARLPQGVFSTRICASNRSASADNSNLANLSGKLLHPRKTKRYSFHPYRLMFIFCQRRRHGCHRAFSLLESVHRIAPPMQIDSHHTSLFWKLLHLTQNKSGRASTIPLNVYFFPTQTARLPQGVFSTRICASNYFASVKPIRKAATSYAKQKRQGFHHTA